MENYANYEQLVGGVETLFSKSTSAADEFTESITGNAEAIKEFQRENNLAVDGIIGPNTLAAIKERFGEVVSISTEGADIVKENAANAFKTAGMSANEYMETVTSFSAALVNGLGGDTVAAAKAADLAIVDMADNANKMGTSIDLIQNAYQGFAKQNYTMLDNLKLGYGGTASEMARLVNESGVLADGITVDAKSINSVSFDKIVEAIHVVQENMGIAGTTAKEASSTIQGSVASMKAAWSNLLTGIADDNADLDTLIGNFVDSVGTAADNIVPRLGKILSGLGEMVQKLAPIIAEQLPMLISTVLPSLLAAGGTLLTGVITGIITALPSLIDPAVQLVTQLVSFLIDNLPLLIDGALQIVIALATGISESLPELIPAIVDAVVLIVTTLIENIPLLLDAGYQVLMGIVDGLRNAFPELDTVWQYIEQVFAAAWQYVESVWNAAVSVFSAIWAGIKAVFAVVESVLSGDFSGAWEAIKGVWDAAKGYFQAIWDEIKAIFEVAEAVLGPFFQAAWNAITGAWDAATGYFSDIWESIKTTFSAVSGTISGFFSDAWAAITGIADGWADYFGDIWEDIKTKFSNAIDKIKGFFKFDWSLPKIKLPHFSITGKFSLNPPQIPHFSVSWYRKAMDNAMLLNDATIFGAAGGKLLGGGEAGPEVVSGAHTLMDMIGEAVRKNMPRFRDEEPVPIVIQCVLDGDAIGEYTYTYLRRRQIAYDY